MTRLALVFVLGALACHDEDCPEGEIFVPDACLECGPAGGCAETGAACRPICDDSPDGYTEPGCF